MADATDKIRLEYDGVIGVITNDNPDKRNAFDDTMDARLWEILAELRERPDVRAVIWRGEGKAFSSGRDVGAIGGGQVEMTHHELMRRGHRGAQQIFDLDAPIIVAIQGWAIGASFQRALLCDIRIAAEDAQLGLTEINLAIIPGGGGTQRLPRLVGRGKALEMILTGMRVPAAEALRIGLVERVVPVAELLPAAQALARQIADKAPIALRYAKEAVVGGLGLPLADGIRLENDLATLLRTTEDRVEGAKAFVEKRKPKWTGK